MGRQSARLMTSGKDHKDIFFDGYYHKQMWITDKDANPTLLWEKLADSEYFGIVVSDTTVSVLNGEIIEGIVVAGRILLYLGGNIEIDWGDGTTESKSGTASNTWHTYPTSDGTLYEVKIYGELTGFSGTANYAGCYNSCIVEVSTPFPTTMIPGYSGEALSLESLFLYCKTLKTVVGSLLSNYSEYDEIATLNMFAYSGLEEIPYDLFESVKKITYAPFTNCANLKSIPAALFTGMEVGDFSYGFQNCTSLTEVPAGLFMTDNEVGFAYTFQGCTSLSYVPDSLFDYCLNISGVQYCFDGCNSIISAVPELWEREWSSQDQYEYCYRHCVNASNYEDIPSDWR